MIEDDFKAIAKAWRELSLFGKIFALVGLSASALSIASIGDTVFQFKGFILYGIESYRIFTGFISSVVVNLTGYDIAQGVLDYLVLTAAIFGSLLRADRTLGITVKGSLPSLRVKLFGTVMIAMFGLGMAHNLEAVFDPEVRKMLEALDPPVGPFGQNDPRGISPLMVLIAAISIPLGLLLPSVYHKIRPIKDTAALEMVRIALHIGANLVAVYLVVCTVAAVSEGVTREI